MISVKVTAPREDAERPEKTPLRVRRPLLKGLELFQVHVFQSQSCFGVNLCRKPLSGNVEPGNLVYTYFSLRRSPCSTSGSIPDARDVGDVETRNVLGGEGCAGRMTPARARQQQGSPALVSCRMRRQGPDGLTGRATHGDGETGGRGNHKI